MFFKRGAKNREKALTALLENHFGDIDELLASTIAQLAPLPFQEAFNAVSNLSNLSQEAIIERYRPKA